MAKGTKNTAPRNSHQNMLEAPMEELTKEAAQETLQIVSMKQEIQELSRLVRRLAQEEWTESLERKLEDLTASMKQLPLPGTTTTEAPKKDPSWGKRESSKLWVLTTFWNRMNNVQMKCKEDQERLEKLLDEYRVTLKSNASS